MIQHVSELPTSPVEERELVRQMQITRLLLEEMGGSLPREQMRAKQLLAVLDVACGAGGWALNVAQTYPAFHVTGIDTSKPHVMYAQRLAVEGGLINAHFLTQDMHTLEAGPFDPASFDLINVAFIAPLLLTTDYQTVMHTLMQLCRPGGIVRWTEMELPQTNSPAFEQLMALVCRALEAAGHSFTPPAMQETTAIFAGWQRGHRTEKALIRPERRHLGMTSMMASWLRKAGCWTVESFPTAIDVSADTPAHPCFIRQIEVFGQQVAPFLCAQNVITAEALASLCSQVAEEIRQADFCGLCWLLTLYGYREA